MIIGISGKIGHGKDAVGSIINEITHNKFEVKKFAGKLKQIVSLLTGIPTRDLEDPAVKSSLLPDYWGKMTVREMLQRVGTEAMRDNLHTNVWVNALLADYDHDMDHWIITDVRFPNEANAVKENGGILIRVNRPGFPTGDHPSEVSLDNYVNWDYVITNNGTMEDLRNVVNTIILEEIHETK